MPSRVDDPSLRVVATHGPVGPPSLKVIFPETERAEITRLLVNEDLKPTEEFVTRDSGDGPTLPAVVAVATGRPALVALIQTLWGAGRATATHPDRRATTGATKPFRP
jgi:hypothetical protein